MKKFEEIFEELQNDNNNELNTAWKIAKNEKEKTKKLSIIVCLVIDVLISLFCVKILGVHWVYLIIPIVSCNVVTYGIMKTIIYSKKYSNYNKVYKDTIIKNIMNNFFDNLEYFPEKQMPEYIYENANYNEVYDEYESEDYIEAYINDKYSIQIAEVLTLEEKEYTDSNGEEHTKMVTKFNGLFAKIIMHKSIKSAVRVSQSRTIYSKDKLEMDSSEFEKYFNVEASDKIVGMQILTADVMEELIAFQNNTNIRYDIYIKDNELYLRFHCGEMFEVGRLKKGPIDEKSLKKYFYMLNFVYNLSNKIIDVINDVCI